MGKTRRSLVPWLGPQDLEPLGIPEYVHKANKTDTVWGLFIASDFGRWTDEMLIVHEDKATGFLTLCVAETHRVELLSAVTQQGEPHEDGA